MSRKLHSHSKEVEAVPKTKDLLSKMVQVVVLKENLKNGFIQLLKK